MIPQKVKICGISHTVKLCDDNFDLDTHFGQIKYGKAEILISKDVTPELQEQALFHEMLHGMLTLLGRNDLANDETLVQSLSNAMYQSLYVRGWVDNVRPVVRGEWIWTETGDDDYEQYWVCSVCGEHNFYEANFCPNCGADMRGENNAEMG